MEWRITIFKYHNLCIKRDDDSSLPLLLSNHQCNFHQHHQNSKPEFDKVYKTCNSREVACSISIVAVALSLSTSNCL